MYSLCSIQFGYFCVDGLVVGSTNNLPPILLPKKGPLLVGPWSKKKPSPHTVSKCIYQTESWRIWFRNWKFQPLTNRAKGETGDHGRTLHHRLWLWHSRGEIQNLNDLMLVFLKVQDFIVKEKLGKFDLSVGLCEWFCWPISNYGWYIVLEAMQSCS